MAGAVRSVEAGAACAALDGVGVENREAALHNVFDVIDLRAFEQRSALWVDEEADATLLNDKVVLFLFLGALCKAIPALALILIPSYALLLLLGWTSAGEDLGRRLAWISGREGTRATQLASGWITLIMAAAVPVIGWIAFIYVTFAGMGSIVMARFTKEKTV